MEGVGAPRGGCAGGAPSAGGAGEGLALVPLAEGAPDQAIPSASGCCHFRNRGVAARLVSMRPARAPSAPMPQVLARAEASALEPRQAPASVLPRVNVTPVSSDGVTLVSGVPFLKHVASTRP